jgi:thiamine-phosphate pyrophosphorylase
MSARALAERLRLVVITDARLARPRSVEEVVHAALEAGAPAIQLRDKFASASELASLGLRLRALTLEARALLFVNDRLDVALAIEADGVHVGPDDIPVDAIRACVSERFLIGASTDDPGEARRLARVGADYIGCGTVYPTANKADAGEAIGIEGLERVASAVEIPVVGIGGITVARSAELATTSAAGVAVIGAVMSAQNVQSAVTELVSPWVGRADGS